MKTKPVENKEDTEETKAMPRYGYYGLQRKKGTYVYVFWVRGEGYCGDD